MKKFASILLGMSLIVGVSFAGDDAKKDTTKSTTKKKKGTAKMEEPKKPV